MWLIIITGILAAGALKQTNDWSKEQDMRRAQEKSHLQTYCIIAVVIASIILFALMAR